LVVVLANDKTTTDAASASTNLSTFTQTYFQEKKLSFRAIKLDNFIWTWEWIYNDLIKEYEVKHIKPCCPDPDCKNNKLKSGLNGSYYVCSLCDKTYDINISLDLARQRIEKEAKIRESPFYDTVKKNEQIFGKSN